MDQDCHYGLPPLVAAGWVDAPPDVQMRTDPLTGLLSRLGFMAAMEAMLESGDRKISVLLIAMQAYEPLGLCYGVIAAATVLNAVAERLRYRFTHCAISRLDGERFAVVGELDEAMVQTALRDLCDPFAIGSSVIIRPRCVAGMATVNPDLPNGESLLLAARAATHLASRDHKMLVVVNPDLLAQARRERLIADRLAVAIESNLLTVAYQPKVTAEGNQMVGLEALVRWTDTQLGYVPPQEMIRVAEERGMICDLGLAVTRQVADDINQWDRIGFRPASVSLNMSPEQLVAGLDSETIASLCGIFAQRNIPTSRIEFELTENTLTDPVVSQAVQRLVDLGFTVTADDFGRDRSNFATLIDCSVSGIKLDRKFVSNIDQNPKNRAILTSIVALARELDLTVVAEGVETTEELQILQGMGCTVFQGFLFMRPTSSAKLLELAVDRHWLH
jgi:diguanylate cyclase